MFHEDQAGMWFLHINFVSPTICRCNLPIRCDSCSCCHCDMRRVCADTRRRYSLKSLNGNGGGPDSGTSGSPAPGFLGGDTPTTNAPPKACPPLVTFAPDPPAAFQLVSPPTTAVSGDATTATCPAGGTSFLLPDGTSTTATLSCSTATGIWSFDDDTTFDATTTAIACGAKCTPCTVSQLPLDVPYGDVPTVEDTTDQCNTPTNPVCGAAENPILVGANMAGTMFTGNVIVAPATCVGGRWVDASNAVYDNLACNPPSEACPDLSGYVDIDKCNMDTAKTCAAPTSVTPVPYTGTNALLAGEMTPDFVCPPDNPILYVSVLPLSDNVDVVLQLSTPLSASDANFICTSDRPAYMYNGVTVAQVSQFACQPM